MKQFLTVFFCLFLSITGYAENKIKMVTYFPVPYVAYSKVNVTKQLDVGLTSTCGMNLGCTESGSAGLRPLHVTNTILNKGKLDLNTATAVSGNTASIGSGTGAGEMDFNTNLRVNTLNDGVSVEAENMTVDTLKLFPNRITTDFPSCAGTGASGAPSISWQKLKLKDKEEVYLMCGNAKAAAPEVDCNDASYRSSHKLECCPGRNTSDNICFIDCTLPSTYKWDSSDRGSTYWLGGSGWEYNACSRNSGTGSYGMCTTTVALQKNETYPCWNGAALARSHGVSIVAYQGAGMWGTSSSLCGTCSSVTVGRICMIFNDSAIIVCDWTGSRDGKTPTKASYSGTLQAWECKETEGSTYRCPNGW